MQQVNVRQRTIEAPARYIVPAIGRGGEINLNEEALRWHAERGITPETQNPLLDPRVCASFINDAAHRNFYDWTFGGFLEDRSFLWRGSYLDSYHGAVHLGIDINVPAQTCVRSGVAATVVLVDDDTPEPFGWGPRVAVVPHGSPGWTLMYAHLCNIQVREGERIQANVPIGQVGAPPLNGNWYAHVHVQAVSTNFFEASRAKHFRDLDGYIARAELAYRLSDYCNPLDLIKNIRASSADCAV